MRAVYPYGFESQLPQKQHFAGGPRFAPPLLVLRPRRGAALLRAARNAAISRGPCRREDTAPAPRSGTALSARCAHRRPRRRHRAALAQPFRRPPDLGRSIGNNAERRTYIIQFNGQWTISGSASPMIKALAGRRFGRNASIKNGAAVGLRCLTGKGVSWLLSTKN